MKKIAFFLIPALLSLSAELFSQVSPDLKEFGITAGTFTNFPANQNYLKQDVSVFYVAPYIRVGQHEFSAGLAYPVNTPSLLSSDYKLNPRPGAVAGYKFYIFNIYGRENLFIHYAFQYLLFKGYWESGYYVGPLPYPGKESDIYINNVIGLGYNLFFDMDRRFGMYYALDYVISQTGYQLGTLNPGSNTWNTQFTWNHLSTHFGFIFKLTPLRKKAKSQ